MVTIPLKSAHYYRVTGDKVEPFYEITKKDGSGMRSVTIRDARELGLVPSVTTIMQILSKPGLEAWKMSQAILSALTLPREKGEPLDVFTKRVLEDMDAESSKARDFGTAIHNAIELWLTQHRIEDKATEPYLASFREWVETEVESIHGCEFYVASPLGYAGRVDIHCTIRNIGECVVDAKTQRIGNGKAKTYPEFGLQLSAYAHAISTNRDLRLVNIIVNSSSPSPIIIHQWENRDELWKAFQDCFSVWRWMNNCKTI